MHTNVCDNKKLVLLVTRDHITADGMDRSHNIRTRWRTEAQAPNTALSQASQPFDERGGTGANRVIELGAALREMSRVLAG